MKKNLPILCCKFREKSSAHLSLEQVIVLGRRRKWTAENVLIIGDVREIANDIIAEIFRRVRLLPIESFTQFAVRCRSVEWMHRLGVFVGHRGVV